MNRTIPPNNRPPCPTRQQRPGMNNMGVQRPVPSGPPPGLDGRGVLLWWCNKYLGLIQESASTEHAVGLKSVSIWELTLKYAQDYNLNRTALHTIWGSEITFKKTQFPAFVAAQGDDFILKNLDLRRVLFTAMGCDIDPKASTCILSSTRPYPMILHLCADRSTSRTSREAHRLSQHLLRQWRHHADRRGDKEIHKVSPLKRSLIHHLAAGIYAGCRGQRDRPSPTDAAHASRERPTAGAAGAAGAVEGEEEQVCCCGDSKRDCDCSATQPTAVGERREGPRVGAPA